MCSMNVGQIRMEKGVRGWTPRAPLKAKPGEQDIPFPESQLIPGWLAFLALLPCWNRLFG